ncbi:MAG: XisI protein [Pleurocapsa sp. SU_196_0]|nr:XisI protein [Pleurocapsa sp. SU_196_0]
MERVSEYRRIVRELLEAYASLGRENRGEDEQTFVLVDAAQNHYQVMHTGWAGKRRHYGCVIHMEIRGEKIWVHQDSTDADPVGELLERGVPKEDIVLAFHPPQMRPMTGFATE